ncbi:MAG: hypothetical protein ACHREM_13545 [Polyangiales bacterium]
MIDKEKILALTIRWSSDAAGKSRLTPNELKALPVGATFYVWRGDATSPEIRTVPPPTPPALHGA